MQAARVEIGARLVTEGARLAMLVDGAAAADAKTTGCRRLSARRVRCAWRIAVASCDGHCEFRHPVVISTGVAWALKRGRKIVVTLGSDARRRGGRRPGPVIPYGRGTWTP